MNWDYRGPDGKPGSVRVTGRYACDFGAVGSRGSAALNPPGRAPPPKDGSLVSLFPKLYLRDRRGVYAVYPRPPPAGKDAGFHRIPTRIVWPWPYWDQPVV
jgi:hypothetical protein